MKENNIQSSPPKSALRLLSWFCPEHLYEEIEGDLIQKFNKDVKAVGVQKANRRLMWNTLRFFRPGILIRNKFSFDLIHIYMILNYVTIAFRNFRRQKSYTLLNVVGLALGMAASLLILQYVKYERSFDTFHSRAKDIYRIQYNGWQNGKLNYESAVAVPAIGPELKNTFPEVEAYTRFRPIDGILSYEKPGEEPVSFREERAHFADTSLFKTFDFKLNHGNPATCLKGLNKVIISESTAKKYFQKDDPLGKRIIFNGDQPLEVTGVFADIPENSHIKFEFLVSYETLNARTKDQSATSWGWYDFYSFVLLKPNTDVHALQTKLDNHLSEIRKDDWEKYNRKQEFILRPLTDIHLYSRLLYETSPEDLRDGDSVYAVSVIAVFILIIAWVNYINLATARSFKRANEVGVRKVVGAFRNQLISQFIIESCILNLMAAILAIGIVRLSWPSFSLLTGWNIPLDYLMQKEFWTLVISLFFIGALLSGFYPAIILSSFKPVAVLKGKVVQSSSGNLLRKSLVIFQFVTSVLLISGSLIVYEQLNYMKDKDLGVSIDQTLVLKGPRVFVDSMYQKTFDSFKNEIIRIPGIQSITASSNIPGVENYWTSGMRRLSGGPQGYNTVTNMAIDYDFIPQYNIKVVSGKNFDRLFPKDNKKVMINQLLSQQLEFVDPQQAIGEKLIIGGDTLEITGVFENFHQMSVKTPIIPLACQLGESGSFYSIKLETANYKNTIQALENQWKTFFPGNPVDYFFLDQFFNRQYEKDNRFGEAFSFFTALALFIASLGLIGLASFMTMQRTKEIGIRKVLGSNVSGIIVLLSRRFMLPVLLSILIACPLGWLIMNQWLQSFPYHTTINLWIFVISGILVLLIAFLSVSSQTLKAAMTKPAETLKHE